MNTEIFNIARSFDVAGEPCGVEECTMGHINNTYIVDFYNRGNTDKYVLQRINTYVFKRPDFVMNNIFGVTNYLRGYLVAIGEDPRRGTLNFMFSRDGHTYYRDENGGCWRMYRYIDNVVSYALADSPELFMKAGYAFGQFQQRMAGYDASMLNETIPDFHNTKRRYERFCEVVEGCGSERRSIASDEIKFVHDRGEQCSFIVDKLETGEIPLRVTHNDTKLNNILMDAATGDSVCIIDLDTVMPGSALYDFGDAIRFGASSALEDERDLDKVFFRNDMFEAFAKGYIEGSGHSLTEKEIEYLPMGAYIITLETGMRFLTDYLEGDVYFKTAYPDHNLVRARNQFKLVYDIESRMDEFRDIIKKFN